MKKKLMIEERGKKMQKVQKKSQLDKILRFMQTHKGITGLQALKVAGTLYLPRRICDLEERGHIIDREWIKVKNADGKKIRVIQYRLVK